MYRQLLPSHLFSSHSDSSPSFFSLLAPSHHTPPPAAPYLPPSPLLPSPIFLPPPPYPFHLLFSSPLLPHLPYPYLPYLPSPPLSPPLPGIGGSSSGGAAVAGILGFMGGYPDPLASEGFLYSQRLAEAYKHVFAVRTVLTLTILLLHLVLNLIKIDMDCFYSEL